MRKQLLLFFVNIVFSQTLFAQHELCFKSGLESPMGQMYWVYTPAASYTLSYAVHRDTKRGTLSKGVSIGYFSFSPKSDIFYYLFGDNEYGTVKYSNYSVVPITLSLQAHRTLGKKMEFLYGLDLGYNFVRFTIEDKNPYAEVTSSNIEGKGAVALKTGLNFLLSEHLGIMYQPKFNTLFSIGSTNSSSPQYNSNVGSFDIIFSNHLGVFIRF